MYTVAKELVQICTEDEYSNLQDPNQKFPGK